MTYKWNYQPLTLQQRQEADELLPACGQLFPIAEVLLRRGINTRRGAERFFVPAIADLYDPFLMPDNEQGCGTAQQGNGCEAAHNDLRGL